ncbi:MAG: methylmalonyl Co-A mutase-associated GTPase MeaB [Candidatus Caldarchaeum sp.]
MDVDELVQLVLAGDVKAVAKSISLVESLSPNAWDFVTKISSKVRGVPVIGFIGPPGSGKSTLIGKTLEHFKKSGLSVAVLAVDPSSPFTGGSVLGDRVRMTHLPADKQIFIRSMATRGAGGGIALPVKPVLRIFDAAGYDIIILETAGAGQTDVAVHETVDLVVVVVTSDMGDSIQAVKAGLLEVGDLYVVNKSDDPRSSLTAKMLETFLHRRKDHVAVLRTNALTGEGAKELADAILHTWQQLRASGEVEKRRKSQLIAEIKTIVQEQVRTALQKPENQQIIAKIAEQEQNPYRASLKIIRTVFRKN